MKKIAFVTSVEQPDFAEDDKLLVNALQSKNTAPIAVPWDAKGTRWQDFDLIVVRSCWNYFKKVAEFEEWLNEMKKGNFPICNSIDTVTWNMNKKYLEELRLKNIDIPDTLWLDKLPINYPELIEVLAHKKWKKIVIKPCVSAGSFQTITATFDTLEAQFDSLREVEYKGGIILQEFAQEIVEQGELSLIYFDNLFSHAVIKRPKSGDFRVQSQFGGSVELLHADDKLLDQANRIMNATGNEKLLYARVDGFIKDGKFTLMELELIEPNLFFAFSEKASFLLAEKIMARLN